MKLLTTDIFGCRDKAKVRNDIIFKQDVMNYFAKFEKFLPHSIIIPSFMTIGSQMPELDSGGILPPHIKLVVKIQRDPAFKKVDFKKVRHYFSGKVSSYKKVFSLKNITFL